MDRGRGKDLREFGVALVIISGVAMAVLGTAPVYGRHPNAVWFVTGLCVFVGGALLFVCGLIGPRLPNYIFHPIKGFKKAREPHQETMREFLARGGPDVDEYHKRSLDSLMKMRGRMTGPDDHQTSEPMKQTANRCGLCGSLLSRRADGSLWCPKHSPNANG